MLGEADRAAGIPGGVGAIVRREGFTRQRCRTAASARRRRLRSAEPRQAWPQNRRTKPAGGGTCAFAARQPPPEASLERAEAIIEIQKKVAVFAGPPTENDEGPNGRRGGSGAGSGLIAAACAALGLSRASLHRRQAFRRQPLAAAVRPRPTPIRALVGKSGQVVLDLLREPRFVDLAPAEVYASLL